VKQVYSTYTDTSCG